MKEETTIQKAKFDSYQILIIVLLAFTQFTVVLDFMVMSPLGDILMKSMKLSTTQFGFAVSAYAISAGISGLLTAGFADRYDRKKMLLFFYTGFILGTLFCGLSTSYPLLIAARIITGIFGGVIGSISMAIVADLFKIHQRGSVMGFMQMGFGGSQVLGIPISLYLSNIWGWQSPFLLIVGIATIVFLVLLLYMKPIVKHLEVEKERNAIRHLLKTVANRNYRIGFLATALLSLGGFMMMPWGSAFSINNLKITPEQLPLLFMIAGIATFFIMPVIGKLSDRIEKYTIFTFASVWMILVVLIYTNLSATPFWLVMFLNIAMMIGIMGRMVPAMALTSALPEMHDRGAFMSINASLQQIAGGIASGIGGLIVVQQTKTSPIEHYNILGYVIVFITILCVFLIHRVNKIIKVKHTN